jgi:hypothetical protein
MKTKILLPLFVAACARVLAAQPDVMTVAVFDFEAKGDARDLGSQASTLIAARLSAEPELVVVERAELEKVLSEHELTLSGNVSPDSAAKIQKLTGAKILVTGRVFKVEKNTVMVAKVMGTETGRVYGEMVEGGPAVSVIDLSSQLEKKIALIVNGKADTLVAKTVSDEERIAKIKQAVQGKALPTVVVRISERHVGRHHPTGDPAAQTTLQSILQQCGFKLVDGTSQESPAIEISGEAFSAFGLQKGNLVTCKARVELKVRDVASGAIRVVDQQTSSGVDVAEATAGKTALEHAALALAERIVPKLAQ